VLQRLLQPCGGDCEALCQAIDEVRAEIRGVRFCLQTEREPACVVVMGPGHVVRSACAALVERLPLQPEHRFESFFALHFTMREVWDLPQDDELTDASLDRDWIDLGDPSVLAGGGEACGGDSDSTGGGAANQGRSPAALLRGRLNKVLPECLDLHIFMDENPFASWGPREVRVDIIGALTPDSWDAASRTILACEAQGVYLSRRYDAVFWGAEPSMLPLLEEQVVCALSHWKGEKMSLGLGFGLAESAFTGFEDLAANVSAVLRRGVTTRLAQA